MEGESSQKQGERKYNAEDKQKATDIMTDPLH
jgi:hypothetical protein